MLLTLTDLILRTKTGPASGRTELSDLRCTGLTFRVTDKGSKSFTFRFRCPISGRLTRHTLGRYPDISLAAARTQADALRGLVAKGINPVDEKRRDKTSAASRSVGAVAQRYVEEYARRHKAPSSAVQDERSLDLHVLPKWRHRHLSSIRRADVIELVEGIVQAGKPVQANRVQALISGLFTFAIEAEIVETNPCAGLKKRGVETPATRVLTDAEIRQLWSRALSTPMEPLTGLALRLILLTGARAGEVAGLHRRELENFENANDRVWLIPGDRTKNGRAHAVPLSNLAHSTISSALKLGNPQKDFVFASSRKMDRPIGAHTLTVAMSRLNDVLDGPGSETWTADPPTPHDLRRTVATRLASLGVPGEDVSATLNHTRRDITGRVYDRYDRLAEKRRALVRLSTHLHSLLQGQ